MGLNDENQSREEAAHQIEICFDLLCAYFEKGAEITTVNLVYELFTTPDIMRKTELLLSHDLGEFALSKAWSDLMKEKRDLTLLAYTALQVEVLRPGTVPQELLASLSAQIDPGKLSTACIDALKGGDIEYIEEVELLLQRESDLSRLIAYQRVAELVKAGHLTSEKVSACGRDINDDLERFNALVLGIHQKGGQVA